MEKEMAELYGIMAGDGCLSNTGKGPGSGNKYWIYICGHREDDKEHYDFIKKLFKEIFCKEVKTIERMKENAIVIRFSDKNIFNKFVDLGYPKRDKYDFLEIPSWIAKDKDKLVCFLRGLFDTDGTVIFSKQHKDFPYYPRIEITTKSENLAKQIRESLISLGIKCTSNRKLIYHRIEVAGEERCKKWIEIIRTNNKKHQLKFDRILS